MPIALLLVFLFLTSSLSAQAESTPSDGSPAPLAQAEDAAPPPESEAEAEADAMDEAAEKSDDDGQEGDKGEEQPAVVWTGAVGAGLLALAGNSSAITTNATAALERRQEHWIIALKAGGTYGESRAVDETAQVLAQAASVLVRTDLRLNPQLSLYLAGGADLDRVKSIDWRATGESGLGYIFLNRMDGERQTLFLRLDAAFRYQYEARFQFFPTEENLDDVQLRAPRLALAFRSAPNTAWGLLQEVEVLANVGESRFLVNSLTKLSVTVLRRLALTSAVTVAYDSAPALGREPTDLTVSVGFEVPFT